MQRGDRRIAPVNTVGFVVGEDEFRVPKRIARMFHQFAVMEDSDVEDDDADTDDDAEHIAAEVVTVVDRPAVAADENVVPLLLRGLTAARMAQIIEFCHHHCYVLPMKPFEHPLQDTNLRALMPDEQSWYVDFIERIDNDPKHQNFAEFLMVVNGLDIKPLLELCKARFASFLIGKTPEELTTFFNT